MQCVTRLNILLLRSSVWQTQNTSPINFVVSDYARVMCSHKLLSYCTLAAFIKK